MAKTQESDFLNLPVLGQKPIGKVWAKTPAKYQKPADLCGGCPLYDLSSGFSKPEGRGSIPLLIVGDALDDAGCKDGLPLRPYTATGSVIEKAIKDAGYTREQFVLFNTVNCKPPSGELEGQWYEQSAINHCRTHFDKVIEQFRPQAILALGNVALSALTGHSGKDRTVSSLRGYVLWSERYNLPVIPTYHPSFVRRGGLKLLWVLRHDLQKAASVAQGKFSNYVIAQTPADLCDPFQAGGEKVNYWTDAGEEAMESLLATLAADPNLPLAVDIETDYSMGKSEEEYSTEKFKWETLGFDGKLHELSGSGAITQIQFSIAKNSGIAVKWTQDNLALIKELLATPNPKLAHNGWRFDYPLLRAFGMNLGGVLHDTMCLWHHYQPDLPQGLQFVASFFGMRFPWKHMAIMDIGTYGVADVDAVLHIWDKLPEVMQRKASKETKVNLWESYLDKVVALQPILEGMQTRGIGVNVEGQAKLREWVASEQERVNAELQPLIPAEVKKRKEWKTWPEDVKPIMDEYKRVLASEIEIDLIGQGKKVTKKALAVTVKIPDMASSLLGSMWRDKIEALGYRFNTDTLYKELAYNPNSTFQLRDLLKHFKVDIPVNIDGAETTGKGELRKLLKKSKAGEVIPIVTKTLEYRELGKAIGTYIDGKGWTPDAEGRVHTTFTFKSATWQLTSIEPNVQNIAKHTRLGGEIRKLIVPKPGNVLLEADYSSFHVLTLGYNAESKPYMDLARSDAHSYVCAHMLKTRIKEDTTDELEIETREHIKDLDLWLTLPREEFLARLGWIKKHYGKGLRQQAKAGILGVGLGLGVDKLHSHNEDSFNPRDVEAERWLYDNPKAQFYSPIAKAMKPASYFPKEMQVMLAQEKLGKAAAKELRNLLERLFPEVFKWQQKIRAQAHRDGYLVSRYGGIRWFHNVFEWNAQRGMEVPGEDAEAAIAFFVQNDAFGKIREAMLEVDRETYWGKCLTNTVHDSLVFEIHESAVLQAQREIKEIMERPAKLLKHPVLCPEGLACGVEVSVGSNWNNLKEIHI